MTIEIPRWIWDLNDNILEASHLDQEIHIQKVEDIVYIPDMHYYISFWLQRQSIRT